MRPSTDVETFRKLSIEVVRARDENDTNKLADAVLEITALLGCLAGDIEDVYDFMRRIDALDRTR